MAVTLCTRLSDLQLEEIIAVIRHGRDIRSHPCGFKREYGFSAVLISPANNYEQTEAILLAWVRYGACYYPCADKYLHERALAIPSPLSCTPNSAYLLRRCHRGSPGFFTETIPVILHHRGQDGFACSRSTALMRPMHSFVLILKGGTVLRLIGGATITGSLA